MPPEILLLPSQRRVPIPDGTTLHEAITRAGLPIASACGADGICGRCGVEVLHGAAFLSPETPAERETKRRNRVPDDQRLACRATAHGDVTVRAGYW